MTMMEPMQEERSQHGATRPSPKRGSARSLKTGTADQAVTALHSTPSNGSASDGGVGGAPSASVPQVTCVGFKVLLFSKEMSGEERRHAERTSDRLHTLRGWMHWLMNSAADAWRYADKRASTTNPDKQVRDRGEVTAEVKAACDRQRAFARTRYDEIATGIEKLRAKLGAAKARKRAKDVDALEEQLAAELRKAERYRSASELALPGSMRDVIVVRAEDAFKKWSKNKGAMAYPSFRHGQPIHYRDGDWVIERGDRTGRYRLTIPVGGEGRAIERVTLDVVPDSGSAHAFAKMLLDGRAKPCNAMITWSEKKRQWFAKLVIRYERVAPQRVTEAGACSLRLGVHNAIVLAFDNGDVEVIRGNGLMAYKERLNARRVAIQNHLRSKEAGSGARGRGKKRRFQALDRLSSHEENHVDKTIGEWARRVAYFMGPDPRIGRPRRASTLFVAIEPSSMADVARKERRASEDDSAADKTASIVAAYLGRFPRAKLRDAIVRAVAEGQRGPDGQRRGEVCEVKEVKTHLDARTCPNCEHEHRARPCGDVFHCDVCGASAPADHVAAWNLINDMVGSKVPFRERLKKRADLIKMTRGDGNDDV